MSQGKCGRLFLKSIMLESLNIFKRQIFFNYNYKNDSHYIRDLLIMFEKHCPPFNGNRTSFSNVLIG